MENQWCSTPIYIPQTFLECFSFHLYLYVLALTIIIDNMLLSADYNYQESLSTLQFANRAKNIKNTTRRNEVCVPVQLFCYS